MQSNDIPPPHSSYPLAARGKKLFGDQNLNCAAYIIKLNHQMASFPPPFPG